MTRANLQWVLDRRPEAGLDGSQLRMQSAAVPALQAEEVLVRNLYLSLDPTYRLWMSDRAQYLPPVALGSVMRGLTLGIVEDSRSPRFQAGDLVSAGDGGWQQYTVQRDRALRKLPDVPGVPLTAHLSVLGATGMTAYFGLLDIGQPQAGETLVVSAAAGAVGSVVGQIGKRLGCRVIGIAGGPDKCRWLTDTLGFDGAIDHRQGDIGPALDALCPEGIDIQFENVGGPIMNACFDRLRRNGRLVLCGLISSYNQEGPLPGPSDFGRILMQRLTVRGFIVIDYLKRFGEGTDALGQWISEGRLQWKDHVAAEGFEQAPQALERLFRGDHGGKLMLQVTAHAAA